MNMKKIVFGIVLVVLPLMSQAQLGGMGDRL
jgi:hypothetical protein